MMVAEMACGESCLPEPVVPSPSLKTCTTESMNASRSPCSDYRNLSNAMDGYASLTVSDGSTGSLDLLNQTEDTGSLTYSDRDTIDTSADSMSYQDSSSTAPYSTFCNDLMLDYVPAALMSKEEHMNNAAVMTHLGLHVYNMKGRTQRCAAGNCFALRNKVILLPLDAIMTCNSSLWFSPLVVCSSFLIREYFVNFVTKQENHLHWTE